MPSRGATRDMLDDITFFNGFDAGNLTPGGPGGGSGGGNVVLVNPGVSILGILVTDLPGNPAPNTAIDLAALGIAGATLILNEQTIGGDGVKPLDGSKRYTLHFPPGQLPQVNAFWSITMYDPTYNLVANPINRYAIGNRTQGLKKDADGGLTLYIQSDSPGKDKEANWLPSTKAGSFLMVLRTYMPGTEIAEQKWDPPGLAPAT